jgi:DNA-binding transcriptional MerR regulator/methylmalonyl-CoA mutase cobalamin-binding subunit
MIHKLDRKRTNSVHSVKSAAQLTGLTPALLRAWERRYRAVAPRRDANGRRVYSDGDIARLSLLGKAVSLGHPIHRAAHLSLNELERIAAEAREDDLERLAPRIVQRVLDAIAAYRPDRCDEALALALATLSPGDAVRHVLSPLLHEVGERWHRGALSAAQEHLFSASVERLLMTTIHTYMKAPLGRRILFGTPSGERHALGSLEAAFLAASRGLRCFYLGPDLPATELAEAARRLDVAVVALSVVTPANRDLYCHQIQQLSALVPAGTAIWIGGNTDDIFTNGSFPANCSVISDLDDYLLRLDILRA